MEGDKNDMLKMFVTSDLGNCNYFFTNILTCKAENLCTKGKDF